MILNEHDDGFVLSVCFVCDFFFLRKGVWH